MVKSKICPVSFGLSLGIVWGASLLIMGLITHHFMYGKPFVEAMAQLYLGYDSSIIGSIIGGLIGFVDAFIGGFIIAWLYNVISGCCKNDDKLDLK